MKKDRIINLLKDWKSQVQKDIPVTEIYLFGSSIINDGFLFDEKFSDIDLVIIMPESITNAIERTHWLSKLKEHKSDLELLFVKLFKRDHVSKPIVSVIPLTRKELFFDIHKSRVRDFFRDNEFVNITTEEKVIGIIKDEDFITTDDTVRYLFEFSQAIRNKYLAIGYVQDSHPLDWHSEIEVAPKEIIRTCALAAYLENGKVNRNEKTDLKIGLSHLNYYVYSRRHDDSLYMKLNDWLSKRILRKGEQPNLENIDYLFLSEMIFDMALSYVPVENKNKKNKKRQDSIMSKFDINKSISANFYIRKSGLIRGIENDLFKEIINAGVNLAWATEPHFEIELEEINILENKIQDDPKDGKSVDRLRKLELIHKDLVQGYKYIIYYQNHFFKGSDKILHDILTALRKFTLTRFANVFLKKNYKGVEDGILQAYIHGYGSIGKEFPNIKIKGVLNFGLPEEELHNYLNTNNALNKKNTDVNILSLAANNQPVRSLNTNLIANFFIPLLVQRLVEANIDATSIENDIEKFNIIFTDLDNWSFGVG